MRQWQLQQLETWLCDHVKDLQHSLTLLKYTSEWKLVFPVTNSSQHAIFINLKFIKHVRIALLAKENIKSHMWQSPRWRFSQKYYKKQFFSNCDENIAPRHTYTIESKYKLRVCGHFETISMSLRWILLEILIFHEFRLIASTCRSINAPSIWVFGLYLQIKVIAVLE